MHGVVETVETVLLIVYDGIPWAWALAGQVLATLQPLAVRWAGHRQQHMGTRHGQCSMWRQITLHKSTDHSRFPLAQQSPCIQCSCSALSLLGERPLFSCIMLISRSLCLINLGHIKTCKISRLTNQPPAPVTDTST